MSAPFYEPQRAWMRDAACKGMDAETWFPDAGGKALAAQAVAVCARCEVAQQCLDYAIDTHANFGIWGGMTVDQRNKRAREKAGLP